MLHILLFIVNVGLRVFHLSVAAAWRRYRLTIIHIHVMGVSTYGYRIRIHILMLPETQITTSLLPTSPLVDSQTLGYIEEESPKLGDIKAG